MKKIITQAQMNNRANQLNPNNQAYWKSRLGNTKSTPHKNSSSHTSQSGKKEAVWKVNYIEWGTSNSNYFCSKTEAIEYINKLNGMSGHSKIKLSKCYF